MPFHKLVYRDALNKAYAFYELEKLDESRQLIKQAYYGCLMVEYFDDANIIKEYARTRLDLIFDD